MDPSGPPLRHATRSRRSDHHVPVRLDAVGVARQPGGGDGVVHDLALERVHRRRAPRLRRTPSRGRSPPSATVDQLGPARGTVAGDVEHQAAALARLRLDGEAGQLLECVEDLAVVAGEPAQRLVGRVLGDDLDGGAAVVDVDVDVTVEVGDVEQLLEVVGGDLALLLEPLRAGRLDGAASGWVEVMEFSLRSSSRGCATSLAWWGRRAPACWVRRRSSSVRRRRACRVRSRR